MPTSPRLPVVPAPSAAAPASKTRKTTRGQTLARAQEVAQAYVGDETPLDAAFAAFGRFDGPQGPEDAETTAQAVAQAQALVRALLQPGGAVAAPTLVESKKP